MVNDCSRLDNHFSKSPDTRPENELGMSLSTRHTHPSRGPTPASPLWSCGSRDGSPTAISVTGSIWQKDFLPLTCPGPGFHPSCHCTDQLEEVNALRTSWLRFSLSLGWSRWRKSFPFQIWLNYIFLYSFGFNYFHNTIQHGQRFTLTTNKNLIEDNVVTLLT